jgi:hypothetical protein
MMIGHEIGQIARYQPNVFERVEVNGRGVALYYSADQRHALITRHGVVFETIPGIGREEAVHAWEEHVERLDHPARTLASGGYVRADRLMDEALARNTLSMYNALSAIYGASHDDAGTQLRSIRPASLKEVLGWAMQAYREAREDVRDALRMHQRVVADDVALEPVSTGKETEQLYLEGSVLDCNGVKIDATGLAPHQAQEAHDVVGS